LCPPGISLAVVVGFGLAAFKRSYDDSPDLSVIGKGVPTVVQEHDPGCSLCNQLRSIASAAAERFGDRLLYRIADINTPEGRHLQRRPPDSAGNPAAIRRQQPAARAGNKTVLLHKKRRGKPRLEYRYAAI
jgi:hypothetical protein